jgi:hypothetical protein
METLKQFADKHVPMDTHGQQYSTTIYNINFELGHTTVLCILIFILLKDSRKVEDCELNDSLNS